MSHTALRTTTDTLVRELKYYFLCITVCCELRIVLHDQLRHRQTRSPTTGFNILTPSRRVVLENPTVFLLGKKLSSFDGNRTFITAFTGSRPKPRLCEIIRNRIVFNSEELPAPRPTTKLEAHPLSVVRDCLFNILVATLHPHLQKVPCRDQRDPQIRRPQHRQG